MSAGAEFSEIRTRRPLGQWEKVFVVAQRQTGLYNIASKITVSTVQELDTALVQTALVCVSRKHPLLRCRVVEEGAEMYFAVGDVEPVLRRLEEPVEEVMEGELLRIFDDRACLWTVTMLNQSEGNVTESRYKFTNTFIFTFHHAIVDGNSIIQIYRDFITYLEMTLRGMHCDVTSLPLKNSRDVIFRDYCACSAGKHARNVLTYFWNDFVLPTIRANRLISRMIERFRPRHRERRTKYIQIGFSFHNTKLILEACRRFDVKVNGFCTALAAYAFRRLLLEHDLVGRDDTFVYPSECYVNLKNHTKELNVEDLGLYMTHLSTRVSNSVVAEKFWQEASHFDSNLHTLLEAGRHFDEFSLLQCAIECFGPRNIARIISLTDHRWMPYYVSNMGRVDIVPDVEGVGEPFCRFDDLYQTFSEHPRLVDGSVFIHSLVTVNGQLCWTLGYHTHQVRDEIAQKLAQLIEDIAMEAVNTNDETN